MTIRLRHISTLIRGSLFTSIIFILGCSQLNKVPTLKSSEHVTWLPAQFVKSTSILSQAVVVDRWWTGLGSKELSELIELGIRENLDIKVAVQRLAQARTQLSMIEAGRAPMINMVASDRRPNGGISGLSSFGSGKDEQFQIGLVMNYEVDLLGRRDLSVYSAEQQVAANEFSKHALALAVSGDIANAYFQIVALTERLEVMRERLQVVTKFTSDLEKRMALGDATIVMVSQQRIIQKSMESQSADLVMQRERMLNLLSTLTGQPPGRMQISNLRLPATPKVENIGLPSELLCRRPDIRRAEALLQSAQGDVGIARAQLYPSFNMAFQAGRGNTVLSALTSPQSLFFQINAQLVHTLFDNGVKSMGVNLAYGRQLELTQLYASTVLAALREVENGLLATELTAKKVKTLQEAKTHATELSELSLRVIESGGIDFVQLLQIQDAVYNAESLAIVGRLEQLQAWVDLHKSLGGGLQFQTGACAGGRKPLIASNSSGSVASPSQP